MRRRRIRLGTLLFPQNTMESAPSVTRSAGSERHARSRHPRHPALALPGIFGVRHSTLALPGLSGRNQPLATQHWHCQLFWRIEPYDSAESSQMGRIATCHENLPKWDDVFAST